MSGYAGIEGLGDFMDGEYVEVQMSDGTIRKFSKEELLQNQDDQMKGVRKEKDRLVRDFEGEFKLDDLDSKDPTLSRFVHVGQWAYEALRNLGHIKGKTVAVNSSFVCTNPHLNLSFPCFLSIRWRWYFIQSALLGYLL